MRESTVNLNFNNLVYKGETESEFVLKPSNEAKICLNCTAKKCNGECARLRAERKKLKNKLKAKQN